MTSSACYALTPRPNRIRSRPVITYQTILRIPPTHAMSREASKSAGMKAEAISKASSPSSFDVTTPGDRGQAAMAGSATGGF